MLADYDQTKKATSYSVTNDDGIHSPGIAALFQAMQEVGDAWIVAPDRERSAVSHALTLHRPLKAEQVGDQMFSVNGNTDRLCSACNPENPAAQA